MEANNDGSHSKIDQAILGCLMRDARVTMVALGEAVGLCPQSAREHVNQLERAGIIKGYTAVLGLERLGYTACHFKPIRLKTHTPRVVQEFVAAITSTLPSVVEYSQLAESDSDYLLKILVHDHDEFRDTQARLLDLPMIERMGTINTIGLPVRRPIPLSRSR